MIFLLTLIKTMRERSRDTHSVGLNELTRMIFRDGMAFSSEMSYLNLVLHELM